MENATCQAWEIVAKIVFSEAESIFNLIFMLYQRAHTYLTKYCIQSCYILFL